MKAQLAKNRLLTLTGAGGSGKTRLAIQVATDLLDSFKDGVWWVELAGLSDPALVPQAVAKALGVVEALNQPVTETVANFLRAKQLLLALDNCEHLIHACAQLVDTLLSQCPTLKVLATSRETLGVPGEVAWIVPLLSLPDAQQLPPVPGLEKYEAVQLFLERSTAVQPDFALTEKNAPSVTQICQRLDGIPLAIELAAARVKVLSVEQIAARLDDRFGLLTGGSRTVLPRHQTLRATIDWSINLLSEEEQILFRRLSVFAGGWTLEAAEAVCSGDEVKRGQILDLLIRLVDKSLVVVRSGDDEARYQMLETIREYARDQLVEAGEAEQLRSRHLDYFVAMVERAESEWRGPKRLAWFKRLEGGHDNLSAALDWSLTRPDALERGLRLAGVLGHFWAWTTHKAEGRYWLDKLLASSREQGIGSAANRAKATLAAGILALNQTDYAPARELLNESMALYEALGDQRGVAFTSIFLGNLASFQGDWGLSHLFKEKSVTMFRQEEDKWGLAYALAIYGENLTIEKDYAGSRLCLDESFGAL